MGRKQTIFCFQDANSVSSKYTLLGYANEETIGKHSQSVFLQCFFKAGPNENIFLQKHFVLMLFTVFHGWANSKKAEHFLLPRRKLCVFNACCVSTQTGKHPGNIQSQYFCSVSQMFSRLRPHAAKNASEIYQKHFLLPWHNSVSATVYRWPLVFPKCFLV